MSEIKVTELLRNALKGDDAPPSSVSGLALVEHLMQLILDENPIGAFMVTEALIREGDLTKINAVICMAIGALVSCEKNLRDAQGAFESFSPEMRRQMVDRVAERLGVDPSEVKLP